MDDLLYILAVVAWIAYSFFKNSKKVKEQRPTITRNEPVERAPRKEYPEVRDILRELMGEEEENVPAPAPVVVAPREEERKMTSDTYQYEVPQGQFSWDDMYEEKKGTPASIRAAAEAQRYTATSDGQLLFHEQKPVKRGHFDLRRAIILSEILNRPYDGSRLSGGYQGG